MSIISLTHSILSHQPFVCIVLSTSVVSITAHVSTFRCLPPSFLTACMSHHITSIDEHNPKDTNASLADSIHGCCKWPIDLVALSYGNELLSYISHRYTSKARLRFKTSSTRMYDGDIGNLMFGPRKRCLLFLEHSQVGDWLPSCHISTTPTTWFNPRQNRHPSTDRIRANWWT